MRIAVLNTGNIYNRKGTFNNVHERIKHLQEVTHVEVDVFLIRHFDSWIFKLIRASKDVKDDISIIDGVKYNNLWVKFKMTDYVITKKLKVKDIACRSQLKKFVDLFETFDLLSVHTLSDMYIAYLVKQKYSIPFVATWHGSDINILPFTNKRVFKTTKLIMENADLNFFVSKKLMHVSDKITINANKEYLYTGPSGVFKRQNTQDKTKLRAKNNIKTSYLIGYIGNMVPNKNVLVLPDIFRSIRDSIEDISFIVVGEGKLLGELKKRMIHKGLYDVIFTGRIEPELIPSIMGCLDILILPSRNEGLPRVTLEALCSGVHVVGSDAGGIPESIGDENAFALDENFISNISNRVLDILHKGEEPLFLSIEFSWNYSIKKEVTLYEKILSTKG